MKSAVKRSLCTTAWTFLVCLATTTVVFYFTRGVPLYGLPEAGDVASVEVRDTRLEGERRVLTSQEDVELAVNVAHLLNYNLGAAPEDPPFLTLTYRLKDGRTVEVAASATTVVWKGRRRALREGDLFVYVTEGLFYPDRVIEGGQALR